MLQSPERNSRISAEICLIGCSVRWKKSWKTVRDVDDIVLIDGSSKMPRIKAILNFCGDGATRSSCQRGDNHDLT